MKKNLILIISIFLASITLVIAAHYPYEFLTQLNISKTQTYIETLDSKNWAKEFSENDWKYYNGFMMYALLPINRNLVEKFYNDILNSDGTINNKINPQNRYQEGELDSALPARTLLYLDKKQKYENAKNLVYQKLIAQETLPNCGGNFRHKINNKNWKKYPFSLDGLYMALPFLVEYKNFDISDRLNWVNDNMKTENGLYFHGADENGKPNGVVWLRGVGWYAMTQVDILDSIPEGLQKEKMKYDLTLFFDSMLKHQNIYNGMWKNVLYPRTFICNKYETSGTLMMSYALLKAYRKGYVNNIKYKKAGLKAFNGVITNKLNNILKLKDIYISAHVSDNTKHYCNCRKYVTNEAKGIAPLILTYREIQNMK